MNSTGTYHLLGRAGQVERRRYVDISTGCAYRQNRGQKYTSLKMQREQWRAGVSPSQLFGFGPVVSICDLHCLVQRVVGRIACDRIYEDFIDCKV